MLRLIAPIILIGAAIVGLVALVNPLYEEISILKAQVASYNQALDNSKALENERDKLTKKYNSIDPTDLDRLEKLLPDNVDNIRLILEIEKIASPYGMVLRDVKYDTITKAEEEGTAVQAGEIPVDFSKEYGLWNLEFSTEGSYTNFQNFIKDLEQNLRIVDISSIQFSSVDNTTPAKGDTYKYGFKIKTYWLKN